MKKIFPLLILMLIGGILAAQNPISQFSGPERNGVYPEKNLLQQWPEGGPKLLWKYDKLGLGYSSAAVTSNRVFAIGTTSSTPQSKDSLTYLYSFDLSGTLLWKKALGKDWLVNFPGSRSTPTLYDGLGYLVNGLGVIFCFNIENGEIVWSKDLWREYKGKSGPWGALDHVIVVDDKLLCTPGGEINNVIALNRKTGNLLWTSKGVGEGGGYTTPIIIERGGKRFIVSQPGKSIVAINLKDGQLAWHFEIDKEQPSCYRTPIYRDGNLFIMNSPAQGSTMLKIAEDGMSVSALWSNSNLYQVQSDAVVLGDRIYIGGRRNTIYCVDWNTGHEIFSLKMVTVPSVIISADNLIYCNDYKGYITLLKPLSDKLEKVGGFKVPKDATDKHFSYPVIKDGRLYIRHDNSLFVYNIKAN